MSKDLSPSDIISERGYISNTHKRTHAKGEAHTITINIAEIANIELTKKWNTRAPYVIKYVNVPLPKHILYIDPTVPMPEYTTMLVEMNHRFHLLDGTELNYNGSDDYGLPKFITKDRKVYMLSSTLEYKFMVVKKVIYALAFYLATPASLARTAELFNVSEHVLTEAARWLNEPEEIIIDGENQVVKWGDKRVLVVHIDGARCGGRGIVVAISGSHEIYILGHERDKETLAKLAGRIEDLGRKNDADMYLLVMDGAPWLASFLMEYFDERCIIVEHSHITWWEICVIYKHDGEWYTIRLRDDFFAEGKRASPEIDIPPGHVEVWKGVVHAGYARRIKREERWVANWKKALYEVLGAEIFHTGMSERAFRTALAWWMKRVNMLTRNLLKHGEDIGEFIEKARSVLLNLCLKIRREKNWERLARLLSRQLSMLSDVYDGVKEAVMEELSVKFDVRERRVRGRKRRRRVRRKDRVRRAELVYSGPLSGAPAHAREVMGLLGKVFKGRHISNNKAEGSIGIYIHDVRSCRGHGKVLLKLKFRRAHIAYAFEYLASNLRLGRGPRGDGVRFFAGGEYIIRYRSLNGVETVRRIRVLEVGKRHIVAYCYLRGDIRRFRRDRILSVVKCKAV